MDSPKLKLLRFSSLQSIYQIICGSVLRCRKTHQRFWLYSAKPETSAEVQWQKVLAQVFEGFYLHFNYPIDPDKVDFFVEKLMLVLECNGYCHRYYNATKKKAREKLITQKYSLVRFHYQISLETLFNGILQAKPGTMVKLYDLEQLGQEVPFNLNSLNAQIV